MYPHRIRLHGPWQVESSTPGIGPARLVLPLAHSGTQPGIDGRVRLRRGFGYPGQIDPHERVWIAVHGAGSAQVSVNGVALGQAPHPSLLPASAPFECDITHLLAARNELVLDTEVVGATGLPTDVYLEVRCTAWLSRVRAERAAPGFLVLGEVAGPLDRLLEVYLIVGRTTAGYLTVSPEAQERYFRFPIAHTDEPLRVELVSGASIWYRAEVVLPLPGSAEG